MFTPIDNQKVAQLAGVDFDQEDFIEGKIVYSRTHIAAKRLNLLKDYGPCILVTSFSDGSVTDEMAAKLPPNVKVWFSNNVMTCNPRVRAVPIGIRFNVDAEKLLLEEAAHPQEKTGLCYMNFLRNIPRAVNPREGIYEMFSEKEWVTTQGGFDHVPMEEFYRQMSSHWYVLSPPGAGPDCHRHWEALALGSIPIVLDHRATDILDDMPCLRVNNWSQVTQELLEDSLDPLLRRFGWPSMKKLDMDYWAMEINSEAQMLEMN